MARSPSVQRGAAPSNVGNPSGAWEPSGAPLRSPSHRRTQRPSSPGPRSYLRMFFAPTNRENIDVQYEKDKVAAERHANSFRHQVHQTWHHSGPESTTLLDKGHIVDRGRGRGIDQAVRGVYDPIMGTYRIAPTTPIKDVRPRPSSAPPSPRRADQQLLSARGVRNPITGECKPGFEPDPRYEARKALEFSRTNGGKGAGIVTRARLGEMHDPITGREYRVAPAALEQASARQRSAAGVPTRGDRPYTPSKQYVQSGISWGQYNPITHQWHIPPSDPRFQDPSAQLEKATGLTGNHLGRVPLPANQGIYNPINNMWVVPPANPRMWYGLSFAPATMFSKPTPATIRSLR